MKKSPWDEFLYTVQAHCEAIKQDENYNLDFAKDLAQARNALLQGDKRWAHLVTTAIRDRKKHKKDASRRGIWFEDLNKVEEGIEKHEYAMQDALRELWSEDDRKLGDRIRAFDSKLPENMLDNNVGVHIRIASYLMMGLDPQKYPPYHKGRFYDMYKFLDYKREKTGDDAGTRYEHAIKFLKHMLKEVQNRGMEYPATPVDAQSVAFWYTRYLDKQKKEPGPSPMPSDQTEPNQKMSHPLNTILYGPPGTGKTWHTVTRAVAIIEEKDVDEVEQEQRDEIKRRFETYRDRNQDDKQVEMITFHQNTTYEDFIEGIRPVLNNDQASANGQAPSEGSSPGEVQYEMREGVFRRIARHADQNRDKRYVLVIDEINRGNIARIFGELITLIEDSKRTDAHDEAWVTLPGSQDTFSVPPNLYLLGTMNTADRSIALLDTALRRRFKFIEMMPNPSHEGVNKNVDGVNCSRLLKAMNRRIAVLLDREHQIGHTYFLGVNDMDALAEAFQHGVLPLLQEYFYEDWEKISAALNDNGFVKRDAAPEELLKSGLADEKQAIYNLLPRDHKRWTDPAAYQAIYKTTTGETEEPNDERATEALGDSAAEADDDSATGDE